MKSTFLTAMKQSSQARVDHARSDVSLQEMKARARTHRPRSIAPTDFLVIAEIKPISPAEGALGMVDPVGLAIEYENGGAGALSVLTEPTRFGGSLGLMERVSQSTTLPVLRKDFVVDPYQVWEGRSYGADGILVIARMLDRPGMRSVLEAADEAEMFVLLEAFDKDDLEMIKSIISTNQHMVGVNARDLGSLQIRDQAHAELAEALAPDAINIAESGITGPTAVAHVRDLGYRGVLVGSALMRSTDPAGVVRSMIATGKGSV